MRALQACSAVVVVAVVGLLAPNGHAQESFVNEDVGYRIRIPDGYKKAPGSFATFGFVFGGDRYLLDTFEASNWISLANGGSVKPRLYTLWFPARSTAEIKKAELEQEKAAKEKKEGDGPDVKLIMGGRVFQTFEEWAKDRINGFYFGEEKKQTIAGFPAVLRPMIFEKLQDVPQKWLSCTLAVPGGEFAIVCTSPESHHDKLKPDFMSAYKSFKVMRPEGLKISPLNESNIGIKEGAKIDAETMSPDEIRKALADDRERAFAKALAKVDKNWKSFRTENYLVIHETDPKYAKLAGQQAEDVRKWLALNFPGIGDGYEQAAILKVYKYDSSNTDVGFEITFGSGPVVEEINFRQPISKGMDAEFAQLNTAVMSNWFRQKNQELWERMPRWLQSGLIGYVEDAEKVGGKLRFEPDEWDKDTMVDAFNAQKRWEKEKSGEPPLKDVENLLKMTGKEMWDGADARFALAQCASVVRYLVEGPGSRGKSASILRNYIQHLYVLVEEVERKLEAERKEMMKGRVEEDGLSDEEKLAKEDEEYKKKRKDALDNGEKAMLEKTFTLTFEGWDAGDWRSFQHSWEQFAAGRTK